MRIVVFIDLCVYVFCFWQEFVLQYARDKQMTMVHVLLEDYNSPYKAIVYSSQILKGNTKINSHGLPNKTKFPSTRSADQHETKCV